jgi:hypothetical protein
MYKPKDKSPSYWRSLPIEQRFWGRVQKGTKDVCWEWMGTRPGGRYGTIAYNGKNAVGTHRVAWELTYGPVPEGLFVLHECDNPPCCNPGHLFLGTLQDNARDAKKKGRLYNNFANNPYPHLGESNGCAKLTDDKVRLIRELRADGTWSLNALAKKFKVSKKLILLVVQRRSWAHVK